ncbi:MAG TPA: thioredoxin family protein [Bacteroidetes bacterium]|nr:thioredoxin family protein [Candidatus Limimorpha avicola]
MKKCVLRFLTLMAFFMPFVVHAQIYNPVTWSCTAESLGNNEYNVVMKADIEDGWHLYSQNIPDGGPVPTTFTFEENPAYQLVGEVKESDNAIEHDDPTFNIRLSYFEKNAVFTQKVKLNGDASVTLTGEVEFMCCNDGTCIPPEVHEFSVVLGDKQQVVDVAGEEKSGDSLWLLIIEAIIWGFAALLTPCVFPMVPMTVSFFLKGSDNPVVGRFRAIMYFVFIVLLYTVPIALIIMITWLFGGDSVTADIFNWLSTHWLPNIIFFLVFMIFAASFFGAFEIVLPSKLVNSSDSKSDKKGLAGVFFMALTLVLVSFACTGPIVGTVLIKSTSGEFWTPIVTMLAFSMAFALPFALFALFPSMLKNLPKSGGWLNSVKVVLGFIEVALGFKFLSVADQTYHWGLLDREVYLAIWIVCFSMLGFYLLGKLRFKHDDEVQSIGIGRLILSIIVFTFVVYMIPGMWGAPLKALSGYLPPQQTMDFDLKRINEENRDKVLEYIDNAMRQGVVMQGVSSSSATSSAVLCEEPKYSDIFHLPHGLKGYFDYEQALACAKAQNKPIYVDFTGHGCVNCREMEANVWSDPRVLDILRNDYVVVALYVDDKTRLPEEEWVIGSDGKEKKTIGRKYADFQISKFNTNAQPYYCLMGHDGELLVEPRAYNLDKDAFVAFLQQGIKNFQDGTFVRNINE